MDQIVRIVETVAHKTSEPTSKIDFEKRVLVRPNDTELWIKYITFIYETEVEFVLIGAY